MTSWSPCWFSQTKKQWPYWISLILNNFLHDVTVAMLVYSNKETVTIMDLIHIE